MPCDCGCTKVWKERELREEVERLGLHVTKHDGEYRLNYPKGSEATAYYADCREDVVGTARKMAR